MYPEKWFQRLGGRFLQSVIKNRGPKKEPCGDTLETSYQLDFSYQVRTPSFGSFLAMEEVFEDFQLTPMISIFPYGFSVYFFENSFEFGLEA